jgi:alpha-L-fucosidase 2
MAPDTFDPELAALFFQFGRYLFIASSRPGSDKGESSLPPNLQGVWNDVYNPMWGSKYTLNINLRMAPLSAGMVLYANVSDIQR